MQNATIKVLLAEDDPLAQRAIATYIEKTPDIELVGTADDGRRALELVEELQPDIVLTDIHMPEMSGVELIDAIMASESSVPVVCFTALGDDRVLQEALQAGASGFLLKSDSPGLILHGIRSAYSGDALVSPKLVRALLANRTARTSPPPNITAVERDILRLVGLGKNNAEIANELFLATSTIKTYVSRLLKKLDKPNRAALAAQAHEWGIVAP